MQPSSLQMFLNRHSNEHHILLFEAISGARAVCCEPVKMGRPPKSRTPTTQHEQNILAAQIRRFFDAPNRSSHRSEIVRELLDKLNVAGGHWTARSIRLWFNNNRNHYLEERRHRTQRPQPPPMQLPLMQPIPPYPIPMPLFYSYGYVPIGVQPIPPPALWPPIQIIPHDPANPPQNPGNQGPVLVQYFPLPVFNPPRH
jgi:hypothetical protein